MRKTTCGGSHNSAGKDKAEKVGELHGFCDAVETRGKQTQGILEDRKCFEEKIKKDRERAALDIHTARTCESSRTSENQERKAKRRLVSEGCCRKPQNDKDKREMLQIHSVSIQTIPTTEKPDWKDFS